MNIEDNIYSRFYHLNSLRYAICATTISSNIELWYCIAVFPRLYPNTTFMPNTDYTDYTDNWVVFIIWTDNITLYVQRRYLLTYSYDIVLLYSLGCIHPIPICQTLITLVTESFFTICTDNDNAICPTTISSKIQLWYCIAVFPRLYQNTTYIPNTDYTDYGVVFIIWTDKVNSLLAALNSNPPHPASGGYFLAVRAHLDWIKLGQEARHVDHQEGFFDDRYLENAIIYPQTLS